MTTRKTLSLPTELIDRIEREAEKQDRSFNYIAVRRLKDAFFGPKAVRHLKGKVESKGK